MPAPTKPYQPYAAQHELDNLGGPGDSRPTASQVVKDEGMVENLQDKVILITGAAGGIGAAAAKALYETGAKLFLSGRDIPRVEKVINDIVASSSLKNGQQPVAIKMELDSLESVRQGAEDFKKQSDRLDILINNAGIMAVPEGKTKDGFESQIGVNHMSHFLLFQLLKPLLLASAKPGSPSRVINVSSSGHGMSEIIHDDMNFEKEGAYNKWAAYGQSKTANVYMASSISRYYSNKNLVGLSLHPGVIMETGLGRSMEEEDMKFLADRMKNTTEKITKSIDQGAATTVFAAVSKHFDDIGNGGRYLADVGEAGPIKETYAGNPGYAPHVYDHEEDEEKLWLASCKAVGVSAEK